jgi:hypothetical protein
VRGFSTCSYPVRFSPHYHQAEGLLDDENHQLIAEAGKTLMPRVERAAVYLRGLEGKRATPTVGEPAAMRTTP